MIHKRLLAELDWVARRFRRLFLWRTLAIGWFSAGAVGLGLLVLGGVAGRVPAWTALMLVAVVFLATCLGAGLALRSARDPRWIARRVEARFPELDSLLLAAVEQRPGLPDGRFGFLQENVIRGSLAHSRGHDWEGTVSDGKIRACQLTAWTGFGFLLVVCGGLALSGGRGPSGADVAPGSEVSSAQKRYNVTVAPGDAEIERGTSLIVTARFEGLVPDQATLVCRDGAGQTTRLAMSLSLSDPVFGGRVVNVQHDLSYHVEYADQATRRFRVSVFEHPRLKRADVRLAFPEYTGLAEKRVEDTRRVTAVEGTEWTLYCELNKPVERADLVAEDGDRIELAPEADDPLVWRVTRTLNQSARYRLHLADAKGRKNKEPPELVFNVTPNQRPDVKLAIPARDVRVSPIEELQTKASVWDDFGLPAYGITFHLAGQPPEEVVLGQSAQRNQRLDADYQVDLEGLEAEPDHLLAYYFWADDVGPDGKPRRTSGDMYFAEVRHFEEIFRQGEQPPGGAQQQQQQQQGGGGNAQEAQQLAELQKQIINATWTVIRREVEATPTDKFLPDTRQLQESQQAVLDQSTALSQKIQDAESKQHVGDVLRHMTEAVTHLSEAVQTSSPKSLQPALSAEQAAYQALLKLRAREHRVIRGRPQQSGQPSTSASGPQSRAQRQLDQLQLKASENRYETQRTAASQQEQAQRETRQVLNRLRELARRQGDLNERLKELQSALQEAKTEPEREEIRRRLKRLREQEQEILRDTDELRQRMERPENQERMADSRQNLDQTREQIRQTTEALRQSQVSQAVASGTRAERQLRQMREEFRRDASARFSEEVTQLRDDARKLAKNETQLGDELRNLDKPQPRPGSLRDPDRREQLGEGFDRQRKDLGQLLDDMRRTVEEAEETEPLMTERLYDALRRARGQRLDDALDSTRRMLDRGLLDQARLAESQAGQGIEELKEGVEKAAESVLGDEDEALRRAYEVLEGLAEELDQEIRRADPSQPSPDELADRRKPPRADGTRSQQPDSERRTEKPSPGERGASKPSPSERGTSKPSPGERGTGKPSPGERADQPREPGQRAGRPQADGQRQARQPSDGRDAQAAERSRSQGGRKTPADRGGEAGRGSLRQEGQPDDRPAPTGPVDLARFIPPDERPPQPIAGDDFANWSDRLRDVEEMIDDPQMRAEAARIRDTAGGIRRQLRGGSQGPNWDIVRQFVAEPLNELRDRVAEELLRRGSRETMVPIDRDPVPPEYADQVRRYYEALGRGQ